MRQASQCARHLFRQRYEPTGTDCRDNLPAVAPKRGSEDCRFLRRGAVRFEHTHFPSAATFLHGLGSRALYCHEAEITSLVRRSSPPSLVGIVIAGGGALGGVPNCNLS